MKLPTDRKELAKILVLVAMGVALVGYLTVVGVVKPMRAARKERNEKIDDLRRELRRAKKQTDRIREDRARNYAAVSNILHVAEEKGFVHKATLGIAWSRKPRACSPVTLSHRACSVSVRVRGGLRVDVAYAAMRAPPLLPT